MQYLGPVLLYVVIMAGFLAAWSRALPPRENTSRLIGDELRRRELRQQSPRHIADSFSFEDVVRGADLHFHERGITAAAVRRSPANAEQISGGAQ